MRSPMGGDGYLVRIRVEVVEYQHSGGWWLNGNKACNMSTRSVLPALINIIVPLPMA